MVKITSAYQGNLTVKNIHGPSQSEVFTTAPVDNGGTGELFSPTDLLATALGSCTLTIMGIVAERNKIDMNGVYVDVEKHMADAPRRVGKLVLNFHLKKSYSGDERKKLENAAKTCPVKQSLSDKTEIELNFHYL